MMKLSITFMDVKRLPFLLKLFPVNQSLKCAILFCASVSILLCNGCGDGNDVTVIAPGEDYQLTPQEQTNKDAEIRARMGGGRER